MKYIFNSIVHCVTITIFLPLIWKNIYASDTLPNNLQQNYKNIPVLVTGGCGFIGSHLVEELVKLEANVTILDNLSTGTIENIGTVQDKVTVIQGDITDFETCLGATLDKNIVFHLAAFISVPGSIEDPNLCHTINIQGTQNILEAARINNVKRLVFSSTCAIYGESSEPCNENMQPDPSSPYGFSKLMGEIYCKEYAKIYGIETVMMRYFNVYGPRQNPHGSYAGVIAKFKNNMEQNLPLTIFGDGLQTRDYVPVKEIVKANIVLAMCDKQKVQAEIFNIATGKSINLLELIETLKKEYPHFSAEVIYEDSRPGDVQHVAADCTKITALYKEILSYKK